MSTSKNNPFEEVFSAFDGPASFYYILQKVANTQAFLTWLKDSQGVPADENILAGYKFLLGSIFKCFMEEINMKTALELNADEILERAQFAGIPLGGIPNTCERTILIKRIWKHERAISRAKTWFAVKQALKSMNKDLKIFGLLIKEHCHMSAPFDKEFVIQAIACYHTLVYFNDTSRGFPLAEVCFPPDKHTATERYLADAFPGYVYGLQHLWYSILGKDEFSQSCIRDLHLAINEEESEKSSESAFFLEAVSDRFSLINVETIDENDLDEDTKHIINVIKRDRPPRCDRWEHLDRFYRQIEKQIVNPREDKLGISLGFSHFLVLEKYNKGLLKDLLDSGKVPSPEYLTRKDVVSAKKQLDLTMLWYDVNVLDTQLSVFNGVPAFAPTLVGSVELAKAHGNEEIKAIVFKHPADRKNKFDYSFGLLIRAVTSLGISDYSGWLVFFDCATDHSGFGGSLLDYAKFAMITAKEIGPVNMQEFVVEKEVFKEYLKQHSVSSVFDVLIKETPVGAKQIGSLTSLQTAMDDFLAKAKGKLLEYTVERWIRETRRLVEAKCDVKVNREQIDCIADSGSLISVYECKMNVHKDTIDATIKQIKRKLQALSTSKQKVKVESWLVVYETVSTDTKKAFEKSGIFVQDNFKGVIANHRCFSGTRTELMKILDWRF
jgi:hypothetical protein